ncbi:MULTISPECIES: hypothetical protein [Nostoc]|uniref:Uncharacterized protein n=1 Tax=Nostoc paludosum FACHB-159 TaxID=2692908 RepID=A0ABR8K3T1_9NOSO|nr:MULTISPECIES: hypothetical protein [Nostoc]MBD2678323.1 hypothetical protein [Nostoc sp. FACHB-857]MBD2733441.1 hypothetical protein [Nostoc paludosum FACHB-159]
MGSRGAGEQGSRGALGFPSAPLPVLPHAPCPMPYALCPITGIVFWGDVNDWGCHLVWGG